jgi:hypothetical protein
MRYPSNVFLALSALGVSIFGCSSTDESSGSGGRASSGGSKSASGGSGNGGASASASGGAASGGQANGGTTSSGCPNLAGSWTIKMYCQPGQVGKTVEVTQTGCTATVPSFNFSGPVGANGELNLSGAGVTCTGTATTSLITEQCTVLGQPCAISLSR